MFTYIKMKKLEIQLKLMLYSSILGFIEEKDDTIKLLNNIKDVLKGVPINELRSELIETIARLVHEDNLRD